MAVRNADFRKVAIAAVAGDHEGGDAGAVGLECQVQHVVHQADVVGEASGYTGGLVDLGRRYAATRFFSAFDPLLDVADTGEVFVELIAIPAG